MKCRQVMASLVVLCILGWAGSALAHCEIPCGIYDDSMRVSMLKEHLVTIEKSMNKIEDLSGKTGAKDMNQLVRWINNKEMHANKFQEIVSQYFMTQRIQPDTAHYAKKVEVLHKMLVYAMRCKQTTDQGHVKTLLELISEFEKLYFQHSHE
mgnify:CR=1 FL=1